MKSNYFDIYLVGGSVRNRLINERYGVDLSVSDYDFVCETDIYSLEKELMRFRSPFYCGYVEIGDLNTSSDMLNYLKLGSVLQNLNPRLSYILTAPVEEVSIDLYKGYEKDNCYKIVNIGNIDYRGLNYLGYNFPLENTITTVYLDLVTRKLYAVSNINIFKHNLASKKQYTLKGVYKGSYADFSCARKEGIKQAVLTPSYHTPNTGYGTIYEDLSHRDLTFNAVGLKVVVKNNKVEYSDLYVNPHGGLEDIKSGIIQTVTDSYTCFIKSPTRLIRVLRFYCSLKELEFDYSNEIYNVFPKLDSDEFKNAFSNLNRDSVINEITRLFNTGASVDIILNQIFLLPKTVREIMFQDLTLKVTKHV